MAGDGVKTTYKMRKRSQRNKIVTTLTGVASVAIAAEQALPGVVPPGTGALTGQVATFLALVTNQFWPQ